ncbi:cyclopropane-fatty-acyl-phospholipid synthase [Natronocella acetinitrilica]|uniref:Cyclopropane-fatty-acyl-phospholipid synthase n=1 Tax=Natronocella acetinitrilica TaxID=414046 RepID=A0AAE3KCK9_9GAMM|nr:cyclopropane-fatty-acyl-phospholipid synthase family protein [Natronocella acetinitrilica]MCP1677015.1 cyclopropane-fatty-acyl-phospholipid synthase [Natronocella acetinitrilica]
MRQLIGLVEKGKVPDSLVRLGIRQLLQERLKEEGGDCEQRNERLHELIASMNASPVAMSTDAANEQHYELPAGFFERVLGAHLKYSCCLYPKGDETLEQAEAAMLAVTCERAGLEDGQDVLELGCGWGALSLWMARHYPASRITVVSNSASQREFIEHQRDQAGLTNLTVITADMNEFTTEQRFDRVVSLEMFEHMRNWQELMRRVSTWLHPGGRLFIHIFCHRDLAYVFETEGENDWMGRHFFTDGLMPSDALPLHFQDHLRLRRRWRVNGRHYERTCNQWLERMDAAEAEIEPIFSRVYGADEISRWVNRWRVFFMACAELFGYRNGDEWYVSHYLFERPE